MAIGPCEICGKPYNTAAGNLCAACSKTVDESYIKVRKYIYQNPKKSEFITILEATEVHEKVLNYLIKKGRIEVAGTTGGGQRCRACGKETSGTSVCDQCMAKIVHETIASKAADNTAGKESEIPGRKKVIPKSYLD